MKTDQLEWREEVLLPLIEEKAEGIFDKVEKNLDEIYQDIDGVTVAITGNEEYSGKRVHVWSRVAGVMDGPGLTFSGGLSGSRKELVKTLAVEIGAELDLCLLELTDPVASIMEMLTAAYIIAPKKRGMSRLKEVASSVMVKQFSEAADKTPDEITDKIIEKYSKLSDEIVNAVDIEIKEAQNQIDNIISEMEKRQADIDARKEVIDGCAAKIQGLNKNLDSFISDWRKVRIK